MAPVRTGRWGTALAVCGFIVGGATAASPPAAMPPPADPLGGGAAPHATAHPVKDLTPPELSHHDAGHGGHNGNGGHDAHGGHGCNTCDEHHEHEDGGLFGQAEYLLMRPRRGAFEYALRSSTVGAIADGPLDRLRYQQRSGVRAGIGYRFAETGLDATFAYTYLRSSATGSSVAPTGGALYPTLTRPGVIDTALTAAADSGLDYNVYDVEVGKRIHRGEHVTVRVFGGARFASVHQNFDVRYNGRDAINAIVRTKNNFDGFGPTIGADMSAVVYRGFHLYSRASGGLLTGDLQATTSESNQNGQVGLGGIDGTSRRVVPVAHVGIGGGWSSGRITLRAGYEITNYFGLIEAPRFSSEFAPGRTTTRSEDFSLEGLVVTVGLSY